MPRHAARDQDEPFVDHALPERQVDLGEVRMNYAVAGEDSLPALLLVPAQIESWWGYEPAIELLRSRFQVFAVDLRGQGRSTRTPGRYTLDNMGNDLVRFIDSVIGRPVLVSGNSSGGVLAAWLAAYASPGRLRGAICEDPPLFASEVNPACGHSIRQSLGPMFALTSKWLATSGRSAPGTGCRPPRRERSRRTCLRRWCGWGSSVRPTPRGRPDRRRASASTTQSGHVRSGRARRARPATTSGCCAPPGSRSSSRTTTGSSIPQPERSWGPCQTSRWRAPA